jgi:hypothetical protein
LNPNNRFGGSLLVATIALWSFGFSELPPLFAGCSLGSFKAFNPV